MSEEYSDNSSDETEKTEEITKPLVLTDDQQRAKKMILEFLSGSNKENKTHFVLSGAAGTGKSQLMRSVLDSIRTVYSVAGVAPTHKARKILDRFLNKNSFISVKTITVASLLNKLRTHSYIGTNNYRSGADTKINSFDIFFIDETSMITDDDFNRIVNFADIFKKKIIFIGDRYQIPNPSQQYSKNKDGTYSKKDSIAFDSKDNSIELTTIVRQDTDNPLVKVYMKIRKAIIKDRDLVLKRVSQPGIQFHDDIESWYSVIREKFGDLQDFQFHSTRILAYTNDSVRNHNNVVRKLFNRGPLPEPGELLMGYNTIGWPDPILENSQDYYVISITYTENHVISTFKNLVGHILVIKEVESSKTNSIFIPDLVSEKNMKLLKELIDRSDKVNKKFSTKDDFKKYMSLKNKMVFMDNIYRYGDQILPEPQFRLSNPLLFKPVTDVIEENEEEREFRDNKLVKDINERYPGLLDKRYEDDKVLTENEKLSDSFQAIEKDIDFGYAITVHKSQASSFTTVFIDEADIEKIKDCWSYKLDAMIRGRKEQNQLKYVAYTRARKEAIVYYRDAV